METKKLEVGSQVLIGATWYIIDEVTEEGTFIGVDQDGGTREFRRGDVDMVY